MKAEYKRIATVAREKDVSRGAVYQAIAIDKLNKVMIDGTVHVVVDEKYHQWHPQKNRLHLNK